MAAMEDMTIKVEHPALQECIWRRHESHYMRGWFDGAVVGYISTAQNIRVLVRTVWGEVRDVSLCDMRLPNANGEYVIPEGDSNETTRNTAKPVRAEPPKAPYTRRPPHEGNRAWHEADRPYR